MVLIGLTIFGALAIFSPPPSIYRVPLVEEKIIAWLGLATAIIGAVSIVQSSLSSMRQDIVRSLSRVSSDLKDIKNTLGTITASAKYNMQEVISKSFVSEHKCFDIHYKTSIFIRGIDAHFFSKAGAMRWIDRNDIRCTQPSVL